MSNLLERKYNAFIQTAPLRTFFSRTIVMIFSIVPSAIMCKVRAQGNAISIQPIDLEVPLAISLSIMAATYAVSMLTIDAIEKNSENKPVRITIQKSPEFDKFFAEAYEKGKKDLPNIQIPLGNITNMFSTLSPLLETFADELVNYYAAFIDSIVEQRESLCSWHNFRPNETCLNIRDGRMFSVKFEKVSALVQNTNGPTLSEPLSRSEMHRRARIADEVNKTYCSVCKNIVATIFDKTLQSLRSITSTDTTNIVFVLSKGVVVSIDINNQEQQDGTPIHPMHILKRFMDALSLCISREANHTPDAKLKLYAKGLAITACERFFNTHENACTYTTDNTVRMNSLALMVDYVVDYINNVHSQHHIDRLLTYDNTFDKPYKDKYYPYDTKSFIPILVQFGSDYVNFIRHIQNNMSAEALYVLSRDIGNCPSPFSPNIEKAFERKTLAVFSASVCTREPPSKHDNDVPEVLRDS